MITYLLPGRIWFVLTVAVGLVLHNEKYQKLEIKKTYEIILLLLILSFCFVIRVRFAISNIRFEHDMYAFKSWRDGLQKGFTGFYQIQWGDYICNYPPGYMYVLAVIGRIYGGANSFFIFIGKMPAVIADIRTIVLVWHIARKNTWGGIISLFRALAYGLCPAVIYDSRVWGQVDSIYIFFLILAVYFLDEEKIIRASLSYAASLLTKPQALIFAPVFLFRMLKKKDFKRIFKALFTGLSRILISAIPFSGGQDPYWLIRLYFSTMGTYKHFSENGFNLYYALGLNVVETGSYPVARFINPLVIGLCFVIAAVGCYRIKGKEKLWITSLASITLIFTFCTSMLERYLLPAVVLSILTFIIDGRKIFLFLFASYGFLIYANLSYTMFLCGFIDVEFAPGFDRICSVAIVMLTLIVIYLWLKKCFDKNREETLKS